MSEVLRIGLVGCGRIAQTTHLPALQKARGVSLASLCHVATTVMTAPLNLLLRISTWILEPLCSSPRDLSCSRRASRVTSTESPARAMAGERWIGELPCLQVQYRPRPRGQDPRRRRALPQPAPAGDRPLGR